VIDYPEMLNLFEVGTFPSTAPESHKAAATRLAHLIIAGGGQAKVHDNIQIARWGKILMNCAWNPICALSLSTDADYVNSAPPYALDLVWGVMKEIIQLAQTLGVTDVDEQVAEQKLAIGKRRAQTGQGRPVSMLQDIRQGRLFEVEAIIGNTVRLGRQHAVKMPLSEMLYALARARYDALVRAQSATFT
jgi:2-dehydropantoate 2-reductase